MINNSGAKNGPFLKMPRNSDLFLRHDRKNSNLSLTCSSISDGNGVQITIPTPLSCDCVTDDLRMAVRLFCILLSISGFVVNVVSIVAILRNKLHKEPSIFCILNLTINNTLMCVIVLPSTIRNTYVEDIQDLPLPTCIVAGFITFGLFGAEFFCMVLISLNRYLMFLHHGMYRKLFTKPKNLALMTIFSWSFPFSMLFMPLTNAWGSFTYKEKKFVCDPFHVMFYRIFIMVAIIICTLPVLLYCYGKILHKVLRNKKRIGVSRSLNASQVAIPTVSATVRKSTERLPTYRKKEHNLICSVSAIFITYAILYSPCIVLNIYDPDMKTVNPIMHAISTYLGWSHCVINTLVYTALNTKIKSAVKQLLKDMFAQPPLDTPVVSPTLKKRNASLPVMLNSV